MIFIRKIINIFVPGEKKNEVQLKHMCTVKIKRSDIGKKKECSNRKIH